MSRYVMAHLVEGDAMLRLFADGRCQWCGKELPRRCKRFCPGERIPHYAGSNTTYTFRRCWANFWEYWYGSPRYRRVVLLRDDFTCQKCGLRPTHAGDDGIERPDLGRLHVDHIVPYSRVRKTELDNLRVLCVRCNLTKGAKVDTAPEEPVGAKQGVLL